MTQTQVQTAAYWGAGFTLTDSDLEHIINHFLETGKPQTADALARLIIAKRVRQQAADLKRLMADRTIYQPQKSFEVGEELVFPALKLAHGTVTAVRPGFNPEHGPFNVIAVDIKGKIREFASDLTTNHPLNATETEELPDKMAEDIEALTALYANQVAEKIAAMLQERPETVRWGNVWFLDSLLADVNIGHLHLAEAILEIAEGGPLTTDEILPQLDLDPGVDESVQRFSLNQALVADERFENVSPGSGVVWYLKRMEPEAVRTTPERLIYEPIPYDRALLTPQHRTLEQELDDEWSDLPVQEKPMPVMLSLTYPHRWAGTLPLSSRTRALFPDTGAPRVRITLIDDDTQEEIPAWVVHEDRYVYGLDEWYKVNSIPVGGFLHLRPGPEPGVVILGYDRRRAQREWVRLGVIRDNQLQFELERRSIPCGYDDLLIVGTDVVTAVDAHWRRAKAANRSIASLLAEIFPSLANLTPQNTVHMKTLYSAMNMLKRLPPGPLFAELVRHPAFVSVGDQYWQFNSDVWKGS